VRQPGAPANLDRLHSELVEAREELEEARREGLGDPPLDIIERRDQAVRDALDGGLGTETVMEATVLTAEQVKLVQLGAD
jgi:hypothetical protein